MSADPSAPRPRGKARAIQVAAVAGTGLGATGAAALLHSALLVLLCVVALAAIIVVAALVWVHGARSTPKRPTRALLSSVVRGGSAMRYHLTARAFDGPLGAPHRNETQSEDSDSRAELEATAARFTASGFHVWLYERTPHGPMDPDRLTVIAEYRRDGTRVR